MTFEKGQHSVTSPPLLTWLLIAILATTADGLQSMATRGVPLKLHAASKEEPGIQFRGIHGTWEVTSASYQAAGRQTYHFFDDKLIVSSYDTGGKGGPRHAEVLARQFAYSVTSKSLPNSTTLQLVPFPDKDVSEPQIYSVRVVDEEMQFSGDPGRKFSLKRIGGKRITK